MQYIRPAVPGAAVLVRASASLPVHHQRKHSRDPISHQSPFHVHTYGDVYITPERKKGVSEVY